MIQKLETARVKLWDLDVGAVAWLPDRVYAVFEYDPKFLNNNLESFTHPNVTDRCAER